MTTFSPDPGPGSHPPAPEWLAEGLIQMRLALAWLHLGHVASRRFKSPAAADDIQALNQRVVQRLCEPRWIPKLATLLNNYARPRQEWGEFAPPRVEDLEQRVLELWPNASDKKPTVSEAGRLLLRVGREILNTDLSAVDADQTPLGPFGPKRFATYWRNAAAALAAWDELRPQFAKYERQRLSGEARALLKEAYEALGNPRVASPGAGAARSVSGLIDEAGRKVARLEDPAGSSNVDDQIRSEIGRTPFDWPPRALSRLARRIQEIEGDSWPQPDDWLARLTDDLPDAPADDAPAAARRGLFLSLLDDLDARDRRSPLDPETWRAVEAAGRPLLNLGDGLEVRVLRFKARGSERSGWWRERPAEVGSPRLLNGGAVVLRGETEVEVLRPATLGLPPALDKLAGACRELGLELVELPETSVAPYRVQPFWILLADPGTDAPRAPDPTGPAGGVRLLRDREGRAIAPVFPWSLPARWAKEDPLVATLLERQPTLLRLRLRSLEWPVWETIDGRIQPFLAARGSADDHDPAPAVRLFGDLLRQSHSLAAESDEAERDLGRDVRSIALAVFGAMPPKARAAIGVPLKPGTLEVDLKALPEALKRGACRVDWATGEGTPVLSPVVLSWEPARDGEPARVRVRPGAATPASLLPWLALPNPAGVGASALRPGEPNPLTACHDRIAPLVLDAAGPAKNDEVPREALSRAWNDHGGSDWFDAMIKEALGGAGPARDWVALALKLGLPCVPEVDPGTWRPRWPTRLDAAARQRGDGAGVTRRFAEEEPGRLVAEPPPRYSAHLNGAIATFSRGPRGRRPWLDAADDLAAAARRLPEPFRDAAVKATESLTWACDEEAAAERRPAEPDKLLLPVLKALRKVEPGRAPTPASEAGTALDAALDAARAWAEAVRPGLTIIPSDWRFSSPSLAPSGEDAPPPRFDGAIPAKHLIVDAFGIEHNGRVLWKAALAKSAGPEPRLFGELREALESCPSPSRETLLAKIDDWPRAAADGGLLYSAKQFHIEIWNANEKSRAVGDDDPLQRARLVLRDLLTEEFQLVPFSPSAYRDEPEGWIKAVNPDAMQTGRVRRVRQPGLKDARNKLMTPAVVEVE